MLFFTLMRFINQYRIHNWIGMKIIKEIIENYEGITDIEIENGEIEILIQIPDK